MRFQQGICNGFRTYCGGKTGPGWNILPGEKRLSFQEYTAAAINANSTKVVVVHAVGNGKLAPAGGRASHFI